MPIETLRRPFTATEDRQICFCVLRAWLLMHGQAPWPLMYELPK
jgi:hypothetical protein